MCSILRMQIRGRQEERYGLRDKVSKNLSGSCGVIFILFSSLANGKKIEIHTVLLHAQKKHPSQPLEPIY